MASLNAASDTYTVAISFVGTNGIGEPTLLLAILVAIRITKSIGARRRRCNRLLANAKTVAARIARTTAASVYPTRILNLTANMSLTAALVPVAYRS